MSALYSIFNVGRSAKRGLPGPAGGGEPAPEPTRGAFVTPQSLASFAGASGVVALLSKVLVLLIPSWKGGPLSPLVCSMLVSIFLFWVSESDPGRGTLTARDWIIDGFIALINGVVLFSAAVGGTKLLS